MRIGVNVVPLRPAQMGGAEVYFRNLLAELLDRGEHEYVLVTADYNHDTLPADSARCRRVLFAGETSGAAAPLRHAARVVHGGMAGLSREYERRMPARARDAIQPLLRPGIRAARAMSGALRRLRSRGGRRRAANLRELIKGERIDVWFCPFTNLDPRVCPVPAVITVHDLQHEYLPEFFDAAELGHRRRFYPESCRGADHVIAVSEFTRQGVIAHYGVEPDRVTAIPHGASTDLDWREAAGCVDDVRRRYALPLRYVLYPANTWHHKNHARLIEALARYREVTGEALTLVLTGVSKEGEVGLRGAVGAHGLGDSVRLLGYVPRADLPALYAGAACLVFPSLFEGFGIPLVEAMLVGCPVAASNATSIPEVVGDAAVLFDPRDAGAIARAIAAIVRDPATASELSRRGRARVERFSWARTADLTLEVLESAGRGGPRRGRAIGHELIAVEGVFDDGWMGREAMLSLRGHALASLEIEGAAAAVEALPQRLRVEVDGREALDVWLTAAGSFSLAVTLPTDGASAGAWEVVLRAERTFCPRDLGLSADGRELGVQIAGVCVKTGDGRHIVKALGAPPGVGDRPLSDASPLVTVVTPSFNQGRFIRETIESVLSQSYPSIEYIVMDGGSTDETVSILREYAGRLEWVSERDGGQADAINKGWQRARGSIVAYLNSDDVYLPGAVERAVAAFREHPEAGAIYGEGYHVDERGAVLERYPTEAFSMRRLEETCFICQPTVFLRRDLVEELGYLDESLHYSLDYDLWIRAARARPFVFTPHYLAHSRLHADTKTLGQRVPAHWEIMRMVRRRFGYVSPSWVYAYAHAVLGPRNRANKWVDARFVASLIAISFVEFLRHNRRIPRAEWARWRGWLGHGWRRIFEAPR